MMVMILRTDYVCRLFYSPQNSLNVAIIIIIVNCTRCVEFALEEGGYVVQGFLYVMSMIIWVR